MRPTPSEIDAVIADMIAAEAAQVPADQSIEEMWMQPVTSVASHDAD
jgi:hypothetical protein